MIVDDVTYFTEPFFQDGPIAVAVDDVVGDGVSYVSHAANINIISGGKNVAHLGGAGVPAEACGAPVGGTGCMDFNPAAANDPSYGISLPTGRTPACWCSSGRSRGTA